jgi:hydrogenase nickel incorporation protein HypA/HybF
MHEMGIVIQMINTLDAYARKNDLESIKKVVLQIGELSPALPKYISWFFQEIKPDYPLLKDCELEIEVNQTQAQCSICDTSFVASSNTFTCPNCKSTGISIVAGNELIIKEILVQ